MWRSRFFGTRCIHLNAALSKVIAALLAWMAWVVDDPYKEGVLCLVVIFSALVYLTCGFYGGKIITKHLLQWRSAGGWLRRETFHYIPVSSRWLSLYNFNS